MGTLREFDRQACRFGYRDSLFKQEPDRWLIPPACACA